MLLTFSQTTCAALRKEGIIENKDCGEEAREDVETKNESKEFSRNLHIHTTYIYRVGIND